MNLAVISEGLAEAVESLENVLMEYPQVEIKAKETLVNGLYLREITIPADTFLTGRVWLDDYVDIMISGHIMVATPDGVKELRGYNVCDGRGGRKRAGYAIEDTKWLTVHKAEGKLEDDLLQQLSLFSMPEYKVAKAKQDFLQHFEPIIDLIEQQSNNTEDFKSIPVEFENLVGVKQSNINGLGLFSQQMFKAGDHIVPARIGQFRTEAGKYVNHSCFPNAKMQFIGKNVALVAIADIKPGDEILTNYMHTLHSMEEALCLE